MIVAIVGPTGVGKTKLSIELAKKYNAIIVNCDAMQVYKNLNIGTAKIKETEKEGIPHYLFDIKDVTENYSVYDYQKDLRNILNNNKAKNIIIVGGTGLYLKAGLYDYRFNTEENKADYSQLSNEDLYKLVLKKDPLTKIHPNNRVRLERFLTKEQTEIVPPINLYNHTIIGLTTERKNLYDIINRRVDKMLEDGLVNEAKYFYDRKIKAKPLLAGIGYKELYEYFANKLTLEQAVEKIKQNSRHYAKRQYTFFNHQLEVNWFNVDFANFTNTVKEVEDFIEKENYYDRS